MAGPARGRRVACYLPTIYRGVEGAEWKNLHYNFVERNKKVNVCQTSGSRTAKTLWKISDATERCDAHYPKTTRRKLSVEKKFVSLWTRRQKSKLCHWQSCVASVGFRRQSRVAVRHTAVQNSCLAVVARFQSSFLRALSASVMCSAQAAVHVRSGMSPKIWTWLCMVTTSSSLDVVRTSIAGQCRHRLSDQGVASQLLRGLCRACISSVASIVWCLVGVVVSRSSRSERQRVGMLVWRQKPSSCPCLRFR